MNNKICAQKEIAIRQRATEIARGIGTKGTKGYEIRGCYTCDGYNKNCPSYFPDSPLYSTESNTHYKNQHK